MAQAQLTKSQQLPSWADDLRRRYLRGEASIFVLHGNVYDMVLHQKKMMRLTDFLTDVLLKESKASIYGLDFFRNVGGLPA